MERFLIGIISLLLALFVVYEFVPLSRPLIRWLARKFNELISWVTKKIFQVLWEFIKQVFKIIWRGTCSLLRTRKTNN